MTSSKSDPALLVRPLAPNANGPSARVWATGAGAVAVVMALTTLLLLGFGRPGTETALRLVARLAFAFFWLSYVAGALVTLLGPRLQPIRIRAKAFGLAFAAVLSVHLCLVGWLCWIGSAPPFETFATFGFAACWAFALAGASVERIGLALGPAGWWTLRNVGMNYILYVFALDFFPARHYATAREIAQYLPFAALCILGPLLRLLAWFKRSLDAGSTAGPVSSTRA